MRRENLNERDVENFLQEIFGTFKTEEDEENSRNHKHVYEFENCECADEFDDCLDGEIFIEQVIFNEPATIVKWSDGSKTVVKCTDDKFDQEKGLAMAIIKRLCGNSGNYYDLFRNYCSSEYTRPRRYEEPKKAKKAKESKEEMA